MTVSIGDGANDGEIGELDDVQADVERLRGGSADDTLTGNSAANVIYGGAGDDQIEGNDGIFERPSVSDFSGSPRVTSSKSAQVAKRRGGACGLVLLERHYFSPPGPFEELDRVVVVQLKRPPSSSHACAGRSRRPGASASSGTFAVRTSSTRTPKISSTAWRTWSSCRRPGVDAERVLVGGQQRVGLLA